MTCHIGQGVVVCGPPRGVYRRRFRYCPVCKRTRRAIERWDGAWYGSTDYCACGDRWMDGEMAPRPFERGWRKKAQDHFRAMWEHAASPDDYRAYVRADSDLATCDEQDLDVFADRRDAVHRRILGGAA